jgi:hypothetical protein
VSTASSGRPVESRWLVRRLSLRAPEQPATNQYLRARVTGRATHTIDKKLIQGQRAVSAFGGMKTSEARTKGLTGMVRPSRVKKAATDDERPSGRPRLETGMLGSGGLIDESVQIELGPRMRGFWGHPPTQEQYTDGRRSYGGAAGWQDKFEQSWIDKAEAEVRQAQINVDKRTSSRASKLQGASNALLAFGL